MVHMALSIKFSRPDISNAVREIIKVMDRPMEVQVKNLYRIIKYIVDINKYRLIMNLQNENNKNMGNEIIL